MTYRFQYRILKITQTCFLIIAPSPPSKKSQPEKGWDF
nr:MAG TPA: hypothetical protein [Caudoviricetes sp.]